MPDLDGVELFRRVSETDPAAADKFIFVTGAATPQAEAFLEGIGNPRVPKPVQPQEVLDLIERIRVRPTRLLERRSSDGHLRQQARKSAVS